MQASSSRLDIERFFTRVRSAPARVLMLDYDGTLAPFRVRPADATPYPGVIALLDGIMESGGTRLVIVSGRWTKDLLPLIGLKRRPEVWGSHGWERLPAGGEYDAVPVRSQVVARLEAVEDWAPELEAIGARTERKPAGIAFHWRGLSGDRIADIHRALAEKWTTLGSSTELGWHDFDGGIELRASGRDKGDVVRALSAESGHDAALAYLGDDLTDEDAFAAMPAHGAAVLVRDEFRPTAANLWIKPPGELIAFLARWLEVAREAS
jgi:trehalose-phosphatase